jgi:energy-coupling factor transporter ATP-binding protein EcfA2
MTTSKSKNYWYYFINDCARFVFITVRELYDGIVHDRIDVVRYIYPGVMIALFFILRGDYLVAWVFDVDGLRLPNNLREIIVTIGLASGWLIWAGERSYHRIKVLSRLREAFTYCGLDANKKLPAFIEDQAIDEHVRKLKLFTSGIPLGKFIANRENLEAHLNISVVKMQEEVNDKSRINIIYAMQGLATLAHMENPSEYLDGEIPIGISYEGPIHVNMRDMGHILVAGQTGGGKSNFLKVATSILTQNNPEAEVYFFDFKGGMELADLVNRLGQNYPNFIKREGPRACVSELTTLGEQLATRLSDIAAAKAFNFDGYIKNYSAPVLNDSDIKRPNKHKRRYIIIDEIAQLYARDPSIPKEEILAARDSVNRIARQGRAAGVHLIVATQKPDSMSFDQTVKSNLPAILCFPMVSQAASVSALGIKRAYDLNPEIKGRAVWKFGPKVTEVQTFIFD